MMARRMPPPASILAGLAFAAAICPVAARAETELLLDRSEVKFVFRQMGVPVEGRFKRFDARVRFDPKRPDKDSVTVTIDTTSAALGVPEIDAELRKPEWLETATFPQARFESTRLRVINGSRFEVAGKLLLKGVTREFTVPVDLAAGPGVSIATGTVSFKRSDFRIGSGAWSDTSLVADEIQVKFRLALRDLDIPARKEP